MKGWGGSWVIWLWREGGAVGFHAWITLIFSSDVRSLGIEISLLSDMYQVPAHLLMQKRSRSLPPLSFETQWLHRNPGLFLFHCYRWEFWNFPFLFDEMMNIRWSSFFFHATEIYWNIHIPTFRVAFIIEQVMIDNQKNQSAWALFSLDSKVEIEPGLLAPCSVAAEPLLYG